jgi:hypothetical protein
MFEAPKGSPIAGCTFLLEEYVLSNGVEVTGELEIEVCRLNDHCYIEFMNLNVINENGEIDGSFHGARDRNATNEAVARMIENDNEIMGFIYEAAMQAAEDNADY